MNLPIIIIGGGGHARVVIAALKEAGAEILAIADNDRELVGASVLGVAILGGDEIVEGHAPDSTLLVNGVGSTGDAKARRRVFERFKSKGYGFSGVVHPSAVIDPDLEMGEGAQIMAGAVIQTGTTVGANSIINTSASVDHDCTVEDHAHIGPGAVLCGGVRIGTGAHVGAGATVIQNIEIGAGAMVAAGAVVTADVAGGTAVAGVPAREM